MAKIDVFIFENPDSPGEFIVRPAVATVEKKGKVYFHAIGRDVSISNLPQKWEVAGIPIGGNSIQVAADEYVKVKTVVPDPDTPAEAIPYQVNVTVTSLLVKALGRSDPIIIIHPPTT